MSLMNLKICKIYKNVSPGESYTAVTNKEEFLTKKEHDLFCPNCSKKFIITVSRLKAMFQRLPSHTGACRAWTDFLLASFLEDQSSVLVKSHSL